MRRAILFTIALFTLAAKAGENPNVILPEGTYPYWPKYTYVEDVNVTNIRAQEWKTTDHVIDGWDWSLPGFVKPSARSSVGLQRNFGWTKEFFNFNLKFPASPTGLLWVNWREIEKTPGVYDFSGILNRVKQAQSIGVKISLRILCHSKSRGTGSGEAPLWLEGLGVTLLPQKNSGDNLNFNPAHPEFHKRYLMLINELAKTEIPQLLRNAYVGYASASLGDEGIGPYGEGNSAANDTVKHVRERLDAWQNAFKGMETKVFMGGSCDYGFSKGFGVRRGFVEMYLYNLPNRDLGQYIDNKGYISIDEASPIIKYKCFNGEVNEEYEAAWATTGRDFRFGNTTNPFPYRYFISTLRALQMQCTYIHTTGHLLPQMLPFLALELGRTVEDTPDVWSFLNTAYLRTSNYKSNDWKGRTFTAAEEAGGIETKNFERWLYQRDAVGYETKPEEKIQQAIKMWMVQTDKYYDYIARSGKKIGFDVDNRWTGISETIAVKVTYFDKYAGTMNLVYNNDIEQVKKPLTLIGDGKLKTATFFVSKLKANSLPNNFDFALESGATTEKIVVSIVRVVKAKETISSTAKIIQKKTISVSYSSANRTVTIDSDSELKNVYIYNFAGKIVKKLNLSGNQNKIPIEGIMQGLYIVQVQDKRGNTETKKFNFNTL